MSADAYAGPRHYSILQRAVVSYSVLRMGNPRVYRKQRCALKLALFRYKSTNSVQSEWMLAFIVKCDANLSYVYSYSESLIYSK